MNIAQNASTITSKKASHASLDPFRILNISEEKMEPSSVMSIYGVDQRNPS
jgi:hypothetical protein